MALLAMRMRRRGHRSRKTPTNGPSTVKGSRIVAKATAMAPAVGARSGEQDSGYEGDLKDAVRAHETGRQLVCRPLLEKKKRKKNKKKKKKKKEKKKKKKK